MSLTLRELVWLADGAWRRTASMMALFANANRDPKKHAAFTPADFNPHAPRPKPPTAKDIKMLKFVFVDRKRKP